MTILIGEKDDLYCPLLAKSGKGHDNQAWDLFNGKFNTARNKEHPISVIMILKQNRQTALSEIHHVNAAVKGLRNRFMPFKEES